MPGCAGNSGMPVRRMALDLKADLFYQYATDVATWQMDRIECHMKRHPGDYPIFTEGLLRADELENRLSELCPEHAHLVEEYADAHFTRSGALEIEMYIHGFLDGGRVLHEMLSRPLPSKEDQP